MRRNLFRGEVGAFRLALLTLFAFAAVAIAALVAGAAGALTVWVLASAAAVTLSWRRRRPTRALRTAPAHMGPPGEHRVILLAQAIPPTNSLGDLSECADRIAVVSAANPSPLHSWFSDVDEARRRAGRRVEETVRGLRAANVEASGTVGDEDAVRAVEDTLRSFGGDEIIVATGSGARDLAVVARIRERFALPVTHIVA
jgi:hypothetical protein